ncbi:MAG: energy transducer TonB [Chitinophagaceae bacterium]
MVRDNKKNFLFAGFMGLIALVVVSSCANDSSSSSDKTAAVDTSAMIAADSSNMAKTTTKKKGKVSGAISSDNTVKIEKDKDGVYNRADKMPEYPGGEAALSKYVENNITYPQNAIDQNTEGTVNVSFVINEKGKVINPVATGKAAGNGLDEEAIKVVKQMPDWKPGIVKGKAVKTRLSLPVTFKLADS